VSNATAHRHKKIAILIGNAHDDGRLKIELNGNRLSFSLKSILEKATENILRQPCVGCRPEKSVGKMQTALPSKPKDYKRKTLLAHLNQSAQKQP
jgi:hypothetical protein